MVRSTWNHQVARIIEHLDQDDLPQALFDAVASVVPYKFASSYVYEDHAKPIYIADTFVGAKAKQGLFNYIHNTYVLNPAYNAYLQGTSGGVYYIDELAPDDYFESGQYLSKEVSLSDSEEIGYLTNNWPRGMEEIVIFIELPASARGEISLLQPTRIGGFNDNSIRLLKEIEPVISTSFRHFWGRKWARKDLRSKPNTIIAEAFDKFGQGILTPRESEITRFILLGHSSKSISLHLGISITTVKTHRKNLYAKLGIATQFELFSKFLAYVTTKTT